jgi:hypothetical protein
MASPPSVESEKRSSLALFKFSFANCVVRLNQPSGLNSVRTVTNVQQEDARMEAEIAEFENGNGMSGS